MIEAGNETRVVKSPSITTQIMIIRNKRKWQQCASKEEGSMWHSARSGSRIVCNTLNHPHLLSWYMLFLTSYVFAVLSCIAFSSNQYFCSWYHLHTLRTCQVILQFSEDHQIKPPPAVLLATLNMCECVVLSKSFDTQDQSLTLCMHPWSSSLSRLRPKETGIKKARRALTMVSRHG